MTDHENQQELTLTEWVGKLPDCHRAAEEYKGLLHALDYLLEQTVDMDLKHGVTLTEGEEDARHTALAAIAHAHGETYARPDADEE